MDDYCSPDTSDILVVQILGSIGPQDYFNNKLTKIKQNPNNNPRRTEFHRVFGFALFRDYRL